MKEVMRTTTKKLQEIASIATVKYVGVGSLRLVVVFVVGWRSCED